tara:strand:- start:175 stop:507 length:333 start_codon:yes stop_codon:yes gene_type:complete
MSEKRGNTVKIKFDFPEHLCCEVFSPGLDRWHRVTPNEFRSYVGKRRILHLEGDIKQNINVKATYKDYEGPVYMYGTNKKINTSSREIGKLAFVDDIDPREYKKRKGNAL